MEYHRLKHPDEPIAHPTHCWSGWPGAWCLNCGCEDPDELEVAGLFIPDNHPGLKQCKKIT